MPYILMNAEKVILEEIAQLQFKRREVATTYALVIVAEKYGEPVNWYKVNRAIIERWSVSGLQFIKRLAWKTLTPTNDERFDLRGKTDPDFTGGLLQ